MKQRVIVGIDPGTTTAWAILAIDGTVLQIGSSKEVGISNLISIIASFGKPIIVGCDKRKTPKLISEFGRKCGSRVISPRNDLLLSHKRDLTSGYEVSNAHELDALASARYALKEVRPLITKIESFITRARSTLLINDILDSILSTDANIKDTVELFTLHESTLTGATLTGGHCEIERREHVAPRVAVPNLSRVLTSLASTHREAAQLRTHCQHLQRKLNALEQHQASRSARRQNITPPPEPALLRKEKAIAALSSTIKRLTNQNHELLRAISITEKAILDRGTHTIIPIIDNLSTKTVEQFLEHHTIIEGQPIYVLDPHQPPDPTVKRLSPRTPLLLCDTDLMHHSLIFINVKDLDRVRLSRIMIFETAPLFERMRTPDLSRIISSYQKERQADASKISLSLDRALSKL